MRTRLRFVAILVPLAALLHAVPAAAQWRYPPYPPYGAYRYYQPESHLRINVRPKDASVYVDGYFAGKVDEFDGRLQRLHVEPGEHEITIYLEGYRSLKQRLYLSVNATRTIDGELERLAPGEPQEPQPAPAESDRGRLEPPDEYGHLPAPGPAGRRGPVQAPRRAPMPAPQPPPRDGVESRYASLSIRVQPGGATVTIDGERWNGPSNDERLIVQVSEGRHVIEVERDGYEPFTTEVDVRGGETAPVNISLRRR
ncbi:MAG: PEGA domain-containing protein [Vicinamibacterales bacterium]